MNLLLCLPILLPVAAGILMAALKTLSIRKNRELFLVAVLSLNLLSALGLCFLPGLRLDVLRLTDKLPVFFAGDSLGLFFLVLCAVMFLPAGIYALDYMKHEEREERFFLFYLAALGMLNGMALSGNLMTLYLFFECMTLLSMPLVLHTLTKEAVAAAFKYLFYSIAGASLALVGFFFVYTYGSTLDFTPGGVLNPSLLAGHETALLVVTLLVVVGYGAKAGMVPLHAWLPTAHPVAPAPASAILSGIITKAGVFAILRFVFYLVGPQHLRGTWMQYTWMSLALITVFMGSMLAFKEPLLKKRLAYSSVSQVSYILFGLSTLTGQGVLGALLHIVFHSVMKNALFLCAGSFIVQTGKTAVSQLRGIGRRMPVTLWCFTLAGIALVGIPPTSGFLSKWYLAVGSLAAGTGFFAWLGPGVLLLSALLTAGYLLTIAVRGFFPGVEFDADSLEGKEPGRRMTVPVVILTVLAVGLGMFPGPLVAFFEGIAGAIV